MKVVDVMTKNPITLNKNDSIEEAANVFYENKIDGAPVIDTTEKLVGIFTKSHLIKAVKSGINNHTPIKDLMTREVVKVNQEQPLTEIISMEIGRLPVVNNVGQIVGILTRTDLVTKLYKECKETVSKLKTIINSSHNAIVAIDLDGRITKFNYAAEKMLGYKAEEIIGEHIKDFFPNTGLLEILRTREKQSGEKINFTNTVALTNRSPIFKDGELKGAVAVFQDISDLKEISEELKVLKDLNEELNAIIESVSNGVCITDHKGQIIKVNGAYEEVTGVKTKEVLGRYMEELVKEGIYSESITCLVLENKEPVTIMNEIKTGKEVLVTGNPIFNEQNEVVRIVITVRDIKGLNILKEEVKKTKQLSEKYYSELKKLRLQQLELDDVVVKSDEMKEIFDIALQVGKVDSTVLITGESGVGKEIVARTIHKASERSEEAFIKVNCGAIPDNLFESELFGYEEGAFTGAKSQGKSGMFELADGGTLFLDEIGELPLNLQVKLLRALQEEQIMRVGGTETIDIDVRIISATNQNLKTLLNKGEFREDLYYRLNVVPIHIPPLRERRADIAPLITSFLNKFNNQFQTNKKIALDVIDWLEDYNWSGNVRELENLIERLVVMTNKEMITLDCLPEYIKQSESNNLNVYVDNIVSLSEGVAKVEKSLLKRALDKHGSTYKAAEALGVSQPTVVRKKNKYGI